MSTSRDVGIDSNFQGAVEVAALDCAYAIIQAIETSPADLAVPEPEFG